MGRVCLLLAPLTVKQVRLDDLTGLSASKWGFVPDLDLLASFPHDLHHENDVSGRPQRATVRTTRKSDFLSIISFKLKDLVVADIRKDSDPQRVAVFYAQSASVVGFMIRTYGGAAFGSFCKTLRDGKTLDAALTTAYATDLPSLDALEQKWLNSLR